MHFSTTATRAIPSKYYEINATAHIFKLSMKELLVMGKKMVECRSHFEIPLILFSK